VRADLPHADPHDRRRHPQEAAGHYAALLPAPAAL